MFRPSDDHIQAAQSKISDSLPVPVGYRIAVWPLQSTSQLKAGEAHKYETLAKAGFISQSEKQTERESRGSHMGIICHIGSACYNEKIGDWGLKEGDVVVYHKYAGLRSDFPPGSGDYYHFCNDEDILGVYR